MSRRTRCRSCAAPIVWAQTPRGRRMPVDIAPAPGYGNVALYLGPDPQAQVITDPDEVARRADLHTAHHATCPDAGTWRTRRSTR